MGVLMTTGLIVGELMFVLLLLLLVSWFRNRAMRLRDQKAVKTLVARSRERKDERLKEIHGFLAKQYALEGEELGLVARALLKAEMRLVQGFAQTYLHRNAKAAARFNNDLENELEPYWEIPTDPVESAGGEDAENDAEASAETDADEEAEAGDNGELDRLRKENEGLSEELRVTMDTMSRMLNEYSTMFTKDSELGDIQVVGGEDEAPEEGQGEEASASDGDDTSGEPPAEAEAQGETSVESGDAVDATLAEVGQETPPAEAADDIADAILAEAGQESPPAEAADDMADAILAEAGQQFPPAEAADDMADAILAEAGQGSSPAEAVDDMADAILAEAGQEAPPAEAVDDMADAILAEAGEQPPSIEAADPESEVVQTAQGADVDADQAERDQIMAGITEEDLDLDAPDEKPGSPDAGVDPDAVLAEAGLSVPDGDLDQESEDAELAENADDDSRPA